MGEKGVTSDLDGSALNVAIVNAHLDMASALLDLGADPKIQDLNGTPLHSLMWMRKKGS